MLDPGPKILVKFCSFPLNYSMSVPVKWDEVNQFRKHKSSILPTKTPGRSFNALVTFMFTKYPFVFTSKSSVLGSRFVQTNMACWAWTFLYISITVVTISSSRSVARSSLPVCTMTAWTIKMIDKINDNFVEGDESSGIVLWYLRYTNIISSTFLEFLVEAPISRRINFANKLQY